MVGFLFHSTIEEDLNCHPSKLRNPDDQFDLSIHELDSFADSFLDLDSINSMDEVQAPYLIQPKPELDTFGSATVEFGVVEKGIEMAEDVSRKVTIDGEPFGNGSEKLGNFGSLIEEEMGKVSLEEELDGSVVADGNGAKSGELTGFNGTGAKSVELVCVNGNGVKSGETVSIEITEMLSDNQHTGIRREPLSDDELVDNETTTEARDYRDRSERPKPIGQQ